MGPEYRSIVNQHVEFDISWHDNRAAMHVIPMLPANRATNQNKIHLDYLSQDYIRAKYLPELNNKLIGLSTKYGVSSRDGCINLFCLK
jgi:hypothetical protein